jgi:hypothetical protein
MRTAISELISAARGQAERLRRQSFADADEWGQRVTQAEATRWQELADGAKQERAGLILSLPRDTGE